jgi:hypothetical protein
LESDGEGDYIAHVEYTYPINGQAYVSRTLDLKGKIAKRKGRAQKIIDGYPVGSAVWVSYDPNKPSRATLKPSGAQSEVMGLLAVVSAGALAAFLVSDVGVELLRGIFGVTKL